MLRNLLIYLGIRKAPRPLARYLGMASVFGVVPAALFAVWKNRERLLELGRRSVRYSA